LEDAKQIPYSVCARSGTTTLFTTKWFNNHILRSFLVVPFFSKKWGNQFPPSKRSAMFTTIFRKLQLQQPRDKQTRISVLFCYVYWVLESSLWKTAQVQK